MKNQFRKHYTRDQARTLLPQVRQWLGQMARIRILLQEHDEQLLALNSSGMDAGGAQVNSWVRNVADFRELAHQFYLHEIQIKDLERGLVDFPSWIQGREVFLCWQLGEDDIEFYHDLEAGFGGRKRIEGQE